MFRLLLLIVGALYALLPLDLIPDVMGPIGWLDDLIVIAFVIYRYWILIKETKAKVDEGVKRDRNGSRKAEKSKVPESDPWEVLELNKGASREEIDAQYKKLLTLYHPDKVDHLGEDLKELAHQKTIAIRRAYDRLVQAKR